MLRILDIILEIYFSMLITKDILFFNYKQVSYPYYIKLSDKETRRVRGY